ncbi:MAG: exopolysaccharide biosynthesis protein [Bdellovibrionota bacterium]
MVTNTEKQRPSALNGRRLSFEFERLRHLCQQKDIRLHELLDSLTSRSHALLTLIFALPFLLPLPLPGLSIFFGLIIALAGGAIAAGKKPWLPKIFLQKKVSGHLLGKVIDQGEKASKLLEKIVRPRGTFLLRHPWFRKFNGLVMAICGIFLSLPLPPGTNFPPALAVVLLSVGSLEEDIVILVIGHSMFVLNLLLFGTILFLGVTELRNLAF